MNRYRTPRAFTIIELLVVVSIIALLIGILLPAIGKARDQANLTRSQANIKQIGTAAVTYAAEWNDRQVTHIDDNFGRYGNNLSSALAGYQAATGIEHPWHMIGSDAAGVTWGWSGGPVHVPMSFDSAGGGILGFGAFRVPNSRPMNTYMNGRFYDPVFYAPKDSIVIQAIEPLYESPGEIVGPGPAIYSSYCYSPAAMFNPAVLSKAAGSTTYFTDPYSLEAGFRSPSMSQATYSDLKTHVIEHHWLQNRKKSCNNLMTAPSGLDCAPFFFNAAELSTPVALYFDGHVAPAGSAESMVAHSRVKVQTSQAHGLWSEDTPMQAQYEGYFQAQSYEPWCQTSFHILTIEGIKGRDFIR